jgi:hypothetical protein
MLGDHGLVKVAGENIRRGTNSRTGLQGKRYLSTGGDPAGHIRGAVPRYTRWGGVIRPSPFKKDVAFQSQSEVRLLSFPKDGAQIQADRLDDKDSGPRFAIQGSLPESPWGRRRPLAFRVALRVMRLSGVRRFAPKASLCTAGSAGGPQRKASMSAGLTLRHKAKQYQSFSW